MRKICYAAAWLSGVVAVTAGAAPKAPRESQPAATAPAATNTEKEPLTALLADGRTGYARLRDYACTFTRQERINGTLSAEQVAEMRVRVQPFSVALRFARPEAVAGMEMLYVKHGRPDGKMKFRPAGVASTSSYQLRAVDDPKILATSRRPVSKLGMEAILDTISAVVNRERALNNPIEVTTEEFVFADRPVTRYEIFTRRPHVHRAFYRAVVYVDRELKLPVRYEAYDQPRPGGSVAGELVEAYSYSDIRPNAGIGESTFSR